VVELSEAWSRGIGEEGEVVGIAKVIEIMRDVRETLRLLIPAIEDVNGAEAIVAEVVHAGDEDAPIGGFRKETHALEARGGNLNVKGFGKFQSDLFAGSIGQGMWGLRACCSRNEDHEEHGQHCAGKCSLHRKSVKELRTE
jgi:hypothetical protein